MELGRETLFEYRVEVAITAKDADGRNSTSPRKIENYIVAYCEAAEANGQIISGAAKHRRTAQQIEHRPNVVEKFIRGNYIVIGDVFPNLLQIPPGRGRDPNPSQRVSAFGC